MPGNNPGMLISADIPGADSVIFDLEDAVSLEEKDSARILVRKALSFLEFTHSEITVRINPIDSPYREKDLEVIIPVLPDGIVVPKASPEAVCAVEQKITAINNPDAERSRETAGIKPSARIKKAADIEGRFIDAVVKVDCIGNPTGIVSGTTQITKDPVGLKIVRDCRTLIAHSGLFKNGFSMQTGAGGISLAAADEMHKLMKEKKIAAVSAAAESPDTL